MPASQAARKAQGGTTRPPGLRARLLATVLGCSLLTTGAASLFFLENVFHQARLAHRQGVEATLQGIASLALADDPRGLEAALALARSHADLEGVEVLEHSGRRLFSWARPGALAAPHAWELVELETPSGRLRAQVHPPSTERLGRRLVLPVLGWALGGMALFVLGLWPALTYLVVRPMRRLAAQARALARGELSNRLEERGGKEILELAQALNSLGAALIEKERGARANLLALRFAFSQLRKVLDSLAEGVLVTDQALDLVLVNPAAQGFLGVKEEEVGGTPLGSCFPHSSQELFWSLTTDFQRGRQEPARIDAAVKGRTLRCSLAPLNSETQGFAGVVAVLMDVTRERELEELKETILTSVSHELRTPLTSIHSYTEILRTMPPEDKATEREFLDIIGVEVERLTRLVDQLLDLSSLAAGKNIVHRSHVLLADILDQVRARIATQAEESGIQFLVAPPPHDQPGSFLLDRARVQQVLDQLVANALKFTPRGGRIHLSARPLPPRAGRPGSVLFTVSDTGPGVPLKQREAIFEKFIQLGEVLRDKPSGAGLGLSLARTIVEAHGGRIWCGPNPGGGARFYLLLPQPALDPAPALATT